MPGASVIADGVSRCYGRSEVLHGVSFAIEPGELVALTGPSGSGKTTLLQLIGSLDRPTSGVIRVDGINVGELRRPALFRRSTIGFVFQLHYLLPALSAQQNVELPLAADHVGRRERAARARELLEEVGLGNRAAHLPAELSGGERQRVAVARALANRPRLVLADEPTGALDTAASGQVWRLLTSIRESHGTTVIIASHDVTLGEHVDRSLHLVDGRLTEPETPPRPVPGRAG
ncbi:MAG TPA: ABC transporter ATP-binding protein [Solirubrobacteraceae bacterium]|nr:ABC transporter ATP-binding protein [Solirubrobacteraceae bacterium]